MWHDLGLVCIGIITGVYCEWMNHKSEEKERCKRCKNEDENG